MFLFYREHVEIARRPNATSERCPFLSSFPGGNSFSGDRSMTRRGVRKHWHLPLAIALLAVAGCGPQTGTINGKVMFPAGKPLPGGMVTFYDASGAPHGAQVQRDGSFMAANLPPGPAKAIVVTVKSRGTLANPEAVKEPYGPYVQIPRKYNDVATSGLQLEVKAGQQDFPIELKEEWAEGEKPQ